MVYVKMVNIEKREDPGDEDRKDSQPSSKFESSSLFKKIIVFKSYRKMWFAGAKMYTCRAYHGLLLGTCDVTRMATNSGF